MPINCLRRWPNTNLSPGLMCTLRKHVAFNQCCFNVDPQSSTLARHWNSIGWLYRVFWRLHYAGDALTSRGQKHQITRYIGPMLMYYCDIVCDAGPTLFQQKPIKLLTANIIVNIIISEHLLNTKVPNLRTWNVMFDMFIRTGVQKCQQFPTHSTPLSPK